MRKIHISDSNSKNTFVHFAPIKVPQIQLELLAIKSYQKALISEKIVMLKIFSKYKDKLPQKLLDEDPELILS